MKYMTESVNPTLERLIAHLVHRMPEDPIDYITWYLNKKKGIYAKPLSNKEKIELTLLQIEQDKLMTKFKIKYGNPLEESEAEDDFDGFES